MFTTPVTGCAQTADRQTLQLAALVEERPRAGPSRPWVAGAMVSVPGPLPHCKLVQHFRKRWELPEPSALLLKKMNRMEDVKMEIKGL